jgi:hypothetical protein
MVRPSLVRETVGRVSFAGFFSDPVFGIRFQAEGDMRTERSRGQSDTPTKKDT